MGILRGKSPDIDMVRAKVWVDGFTCTKFKFKKTSSVVFIKMKIILGVIVEKGYLMMKCTSLIGNSQS